MERTYNFRRTIIIDCIPRRGISFAYQKFISFKFYSADWSIVNIVKVTSSRRRKPNYDLRRLDLCRHLYSYPCDIMLLIHMNIMIIAINTCLL